MGRKDCRASPNIGSDFGRVGVNGGIVGDDLVDADGGAVLRDGHHLDLGLKAGPFLLVHHVDLDGVGLLSHLMAEAVLGLVGDAQLQVDHFEHLVVQWLWSQSDETLLIQQLSSETLIQTASHGGSNRNDKLVQVG